MTEYCEDYFKDEVRDGFLVHSMMKKVWATEMDVLEIVIQLCERHNLQYYADWGTLLGTVRHGGFIPWDDDIDIAMRREDYNQFLALAEELPEPFWLRTNQTDEAFDDSFASVLNGKILSTDEKHMQRFHGCPYILGIDIFPLDYIPRDKEAAQVQRTVCELIITIISLMRRNLDPVMIDKRICEVETICSIKIDKTRNVKSQLYRLLDAVSQLYTEEESDELTIFGLGPQYSDYRLKKKWYADTIIMPFEKLSLQVPVGYDQVLKKMYGDYRKKIKFTASHTYPCFKEQEKLLNKR